jgi:uncharacterized protein (UPF0147 family)
MKKTRHALSIPPPCHRAPSSSYPSEKRKMTDFRIERDNLLNISEQMKTGEKLQASHRFLQIANRHAEMIPLLDHIINVEEDDVPEHLKTVIYRILQEAFNNVAKHSRAGRVSIGLEKKDALLVFGISDDAMFCFHQRTPWSYPTCGAAPPHNPWSFTAATRTVAPAGSFIPSAIPCVKTVQTRCA